MSHALTLDQDALTETYLDVRLMLFKLAHRFAVCYGVPVEDLISEANFSFVRAFRRYDPSRFKAKARFSSVVYFAVTCDLKTYLKKQKKHRNLEELDDTNTGTTQPDRSFRCTVESELREDARYVVSLVLEAPAELAKAMQWHDVKTPSASLAIIREHLTDVGWEHTRITETFSEIRKVLT